MSPGAGNERQRSLRCSSRATLVQRPAAHVREIVANGRAGAHWYLDAAPLVFRAGVDRLLGGDGRRWPSPDRDLLRAGDRVGFWEVRRSTADELVLVALVRAPGEVVLTVGLEPVGETTRLTLTVCFAPSGPLGWAYVLADLPAREAVVELVHRRLLRDLDVG